MMELRSSLAGLSQKVFQGIHRNQTLHDKLTALRSDPRALDATARATLGVVGSGEIVYVFPPPRHER